jgi:hypothetical protein
VTGSFQFDDAGVYGWRIEGSFTRALDLSVSVEAGPATTVYVTEQQLDEAREPDRTVVTFETPDSVNGEQLGAGTGTVLFETTGQTTLSVAMQATSI